MQLIEFNQGPLITFSRGRVNITTKAAKTIGVQAGDRVQFYQDQNNEENWFVGKVETGGYELVPMSEMSKRSLKFESSKLIRKIFDSVEYQEKRGSAPIGESVNLEDKTLYKLEAIKLHKPI